MFLFYKIIPLIASVLANHPTEFFVTIVSDLQCRILGYWKGLCSDVMGLNLVFKCRFTIYLFLCLLFGAQTSGVLLLGEFCSNYMLS
jgi:hypothetical protein